IDELSTSVDIPINIDQDPQLHSIWSASINKADTNGIVATQIGVKIQRPLTMKIMQVVRDKLVNSLADDDPFRHRLLSASQQGSGLWQIALPTERSFRIENDNYRYAMRHLLGRLPCESLLNKQCLCGMRLAEVTHSHFHDCRFLRDYPTGKRHNLVRDALVQFMRECNNVTGFSTIEVEPKASNYRDINKHKDCKERADIVIVNNSLSAMIDVSIVDPSSHSCSHINGIHTTPMVAMQPRYDQKMRHHGDRAKQHNLKMVPFIMEAYGATHTEAVKLVNQIARHADYQATAHEIAEIALRGRTLLSVALQRGNGIIASCGIQSAKTSSRTSHTSHVSINQDTLDFASSDSSPLRISSSPNKHRSRLSASSRSLFASASDVLSYIVPVDMMPVSADVCDAGMGSSSAMNVIAAF
ncbi:MAG TPA: hypothetical protein VHA52_13860, partial [Candidatus Babeliaceae bacterium]|nr:hypothetical protein [Candidatus Babeliaceae bacterium]